MPEERGGADLVSDARKADIKLAKQNNVHIVRADVVGRSDGFVSYGASEIVGPTGIVLQAALVMTSELLVTAL